MSKNFLEIQSGNFVASEKNKVNNVNLIIKNQGEIVSLLGPSGIGKTTILRTLAGLQRLNSGKISKSKIKNPNRIIKTNGISLAIVVKIWMFPEDLIPFDDVNVKTHINERPVKVA